MWRVGTEHFCEGCHKAHASTVWYYRHQLDKAKSRMAVRAEVSVASKWRHEYLANVSGWGLSVVTHADRKGSVFHAEGKDKFCPTTRSRVRANWWQSQSETGRPNGSICFGLLREILLDLGEQLLAIEPKDLDFILVGRSLHSYGSYNPLTICSEVMDRFGEFQDALLPAFARSSTHP